MKVMAYYPIHYGAEYIAYSIRSIYDHVDKIYIFYSQFPSFGVKEEGAVCPESEKDIQDAIDSVPDPDNKILYKKGWYLTEGQHRGKAEFFAEQDGYDVILACDYDEVWDGETLKKAIDYVWHGDKKVYRVPMVHLWRSFDYVCRDLAQPSRLVVPGREGEGYVPMDKPVYHFGYAISDKMMHYKWTCHGHKAELRPEWFEEVWEQNRRTDVHPTCAEGFWTPEPFDKTELPEVMRTHQYYKEKK